MRNIHFHGLPLLLILFLVFSSCNNNSVLNYKIPDPISVEPLEINIDSIKVVGDPGNLGTIIRVADWYGIKHIVCSPDCADFYNPKVIAATMGSFARVQVSHCDLSEYLSKQTAPVYGAFLNGENIHQSALSETGFIVMGSESHGISTPVAQFITNKLTIPSFGQAESLNVAMATGIILDNFKR